MTAYRTDTVHFFVLMNSATKGLDCQCLFGFLGLQGLLFGSVRFSVLSGCMALVEG